MFRTLRRGKHRLVLWPGVEADGSAETTTPSKLGGRDEMGRLEKLVKKYERGDLPKSEWLDKLTFRKMEEVHAAETEKSENLYLYIDLPRFDFPVVFSEPISSSLASTSSVPTPPTAQTPIPASAVTSSFAADLQLWSIVDPEIARENPVEDKHRRLVRNHRSSPYDRELKPNAKLRDELAVCCEFSDFIFVYLNQFYRSLGHSTIFTNPAVNIRRARPDMEVPVLPSQRQTWFEQILEIRHLERCLRSQTSGGRATAHVDGN
jgi:hypothetical protein